MEVIEKIPFSALEGIPKLVKDYLGRKISGTEDFTFALKNFERQIALKKTSFTSQQRKILSEELKVQNQNIALTEKQKENLELLASENTFTVVTGHQLNLFSGPVFFIYKILQTIRTAEFLKENFKEYHFVPVFWMATEDHDFEEINHFRTERHFYELQGKSGGAVGRIKVENPSFIKNFEEEFADSIFGTQLIRWLKDCYQEGKTLAGATRLLVQLIFSKYGLLAIDGDSKSLKSQMVEIFKQELIDFDLKNSTSDTVKLLQETYGKVQVNPREINLFYLTDTRNRIDFNGEKYFVVDKGIMFSKEEILNELEAFPEKFSPNALMRPVYQEKTLPNLAYIGGNAEVMYWLELTDYFKKIQVPFPILVPRNSMLFLKGKTIRKAEKLGLKTKDFFESFAKIVQKNLLENHEIVSLINEAQRAIEKNFTTLKEKAAETHQSFGNMVKAEEVRQSKSLERMKKRLLRAEKIKQSEKVDRIKNLFLEVHSSGNWQERVWNFSVFYADHGRDWLETCYQESHPQKSELIIMEI